MFPIHFFETQLELNPNAQQDRHQTFTTVNGFVLQPLSQKLQTDTAFGTDSLSGIMYCK